MILLAVIMVISLLPTTAFADITTWADLQKAITDAGTTETTIKLTQSLTALETDTALTIGAGQNIVLDLNGFVLDRAKTSAATDGCVLLNDGTLTIKDSNPSAQHRFKVGTSYWSYDDTLTGGTSFEELTDRPNTNAVIIVKGGVITGGHARNPGTSVHIGGGIQNTGTLTMNGGNIVGNIAHRGGGVCVENGSFTMENVKVIGNHGESDYAGGIYVTAGHTCNIRNSYICYNRCSTTGGGINNYGTLTLDDSVVSGNISGNSAGGIYNNTGSAVITNTSITKNSTVSSARNGGGVCVSSGTVTMIDVRITDNKATQYGNGVYVNSTTTIGGASAITGNTGSGGNVYITSGKTLTLASGENALKNDAEIGITLPTGTGAFTGTATEAQKQFFFSDNPKYAVKLVGDHLELVEGYVITNNAPETSKATNNGYVSVVPSAYASDTVTITVTPSSGYMLTADSLKVFPGKCAKCGEALSSANCAKCGEPHTPTALNLNQDGTYTFTMPAYDVTVTAEFEEDLTAWQKLQNALGAATLTADDSLTGLFTVTVTDSVPTIKLLTDFTAATGDATLSVTGTKTLDLNGHVINGARVLENDDWKNGSVITVSAGATLTLTDSGTTKHKFKADDTGLWKLDASGTKTITGGCITGGNGSHAGGVYVKQRDEQGNPAGKLTMKGGNIVGNTSSNAGGGVYLQTGSTFDMEGGSIIGNITGTGKTGGGVGLTSATFTMTGGKIEYNVAAAGGGVYSDKGTFTMRDGEIDNNTATGYGMGGGVGIGNGTFTMTGGKISGNNATSKGGGVYYNNGTVTLGGTAKITDNTLSGGTTANDLYLPKGKTVTLGTGTGEGGNGVAVPTTGFSVGVTTLTAPTETALVKITTNGTADDVKYFTSDNADYEVKFNTDHLELAVKSTPSHTHTFTYTANDGKLTATCTQGCDKGYDTTPLTLTLTAPTSLVYDGNAKVFTFADGEAAAWTGAGLELPTITYYQKQVSSGTYSQLDKAPVDAGDYRVDITVSSKTAQYIFTIDKANGPAAPTGLVAVAPTSVDGTDGKVTGVDETMEYSTDGGTTWKPVVGTEITGLTGGTNVSVRVKETDTTKAGATKTVVIPGTFNVIVTNDGNGTGSANPASGTTGMQVTLTATPSASYEFDHWEVISGGITVTNDQFTIGTANVEVKACFRKKNLPTPTPSPAPTPAPTPAPYKIIEGANQTVVQNANSARFRSDADYIKFLYVEVDGKKISKDDYTSYEGSTVVVLKASFIKRLAVGVHTLKIVSNDGSANTRFTIRKLPPTGDDTPVALLTLALLVALGTIAFVMKKQRRHN